MNDYNEHGDDTDDCKICKGERWVCENHPEKPWTDDDPDGCLCGAGILCKCREHLNEQFKIQNMRFYDN